MSLPWYSVCGRLEVAVSTLSVGRTDRSPSPLPPSAVLDISADLLDWEYNANWSRQDSVLSVEAYDTDYGSILGSGVVCDNRKPADSADLFKVGVTGILKLPRWSTRCDVLTKATALIAPCMPERYPEQISHSVNQLLDPASATRMQVLTSFMALMLANNLLFTAQVEAFILFLYESLGDRSFDVLPVGNCPSTRAIVAQLLFAAVRLDLPRLLRSAIRSNVDISCRLSGGNPVSLLYVAIQYRRTDITRLLVDAAADVGALSFSSKSMRHRTDCPTYKQPWGVRDSTNCSEPTASDFHQDANLYCSCEYNHMLDTSAVGRAAASDIADEMLPLILQKGALLPSGPVLIEAIRHGAKARTVEMLIKAGASVAECRTFDYGTVIEDCAGQSTALSAAVYRESEELVILLLKHGANPNGHFTFKHQRMLQDSGECFYKSPLVIAAESGNLDMIRLLFEHGADPNLSTFDVLHHAQRRRVVDGILWKMLSRNEKRNQIVCLYPLQVAATFAQPSMAEYLLECGAIVDPQYGTPPLSIAVYHGNLDTADILMKWGAMAKQSDVDGFAMSPQKAAMLSGSENMAKYMLNAGADPKWCSLGRDHKTHLQCAAETDNSHLFDNLLMSSTELDPQFAPYAGISTLQALVAESDFKRTSKPYKLG